VTEGDNAVKVETLTFIDETPGYTSGMKSALDETFSINDNIDATLANFLSRPLLIEQFIWPIQEGLFIKTINPWVDFLTHPTVVDKLKYFKLFRGNLRVKFVINGNAFLFGQMIVTYQPMKHEDAIQYNTAMNLQPTRLDWIIKSQRPHLYLNPTDSQGGEMVLPFVWRENYLDLTVKSLSMLGILECYALNPLRHATESTGELDTADVTVFAWVENVELACPTGMLPDTFDSQADEYGVGPVSGVATAVAKATGALVNTPIIGPYARASSMAAGVVSVVAKAFGFSRPAIIENISPYKPVYVGNMANTDAGDSCFKLTLNSKQEVTVDPRVVGLDSTDEMTISGIAAHESYMETVSWNSLRRPNKSLFIAAVNPQMWAKGDGWPTPDKGTPLLYTACGIASMPFQYWRGTMRYRVQIIASAFHKGRLRIIWDPASLWTEAQLDPEDDPFYTNYNIVYSAIIDLAETRDFTVDIGWGQTTPYMLVDPLRDTKRWHGNPFYMDEENRARSNGQFGIFVLNPLISPSPNASDKSVEINIFVSCPDLECVEPTDNCVNFTPIPTRPYYLDSSSRESKIPASQAGVMTDSTPGYGAPHGAAVTTSIVLGSPPNTRSDKTSLVFFGDPILSIRQLMKRYSFSYLISTNTPVAGELSGTNFLTVVVPDLPMYTGESIYPTSHITHHDGGGLLQWNLVYTTPINFFMPCFVCQRGGMRWKYINNQTTSTEDSCSVVMQVARRPGVHKTGAVAETYLDYQPSNQLMNKAMSFFPNSLSGVTCTNVESNPTIEVELPYYSTYRFTPGKTIANNAGHLSHSSFHRLDTVGPYRTKNPAVIMCYAAAADDFSLYFYTGPPVLFKSIRVPVANVKEQSFGIEYPTTSN
jgi:hypothetical protein